MKDENFKDKSFELAPIIDRRVSEDEMLKMSCIGYG